jgi:hypothetical protein
MILSIPIGNFVITTDRIPLLEALYQVPNEGGPSAWISTIVDDLFPDQIFDVFSPTRAGADYTP